MDGLGVVLDSNLDGELFLSPGIPRCTVSGAGWRLAWWPSSLPCVSRRFLSGMRLYCTFLVLKIKLPKIKRNSEKNFICVLAYYRTSTKNHLHFPPLPHQKYYHLQHQNILPHQY